MPIPRLLCLLTVLLLLVANASAAGKVETCAVSISNLSTSSGEVITGIEIDVTAGMIQAVLNLPEGWYLVVDNDASWRTKITGNTTVGAASLSPAKLKKLRLVIRKDATYLPFKLSGAVSITKDYEKERKVELKMSNFAVTPAQ